MDKTYPEYRKHLQGLIGQLRIGLPGTMKGFGLLHQESMKAGQLSEKHKERIALGIGIASRCDSYITFHTHEALAHGATREEISETKRIRFEAEQTGLRRKKPPRSH